MQNRKLSAQEAGTLLADIEVDDLELPDISTLGKMNDPVKLENNEWIVYLLTAKQDQQNLRYILALLQGHFNLNSRLEALQLLIHKTSEYKQVLITEFSGDQELLSSSIIIGNHIQACLLVATVNPHLFKEDWNDSYVDNEFNFALNQLSAMYHHINPDSTHSGSLGNMEELLYLRENVSPTELVKMVLRYFADFYFTLRSPEENYQLLLKLFPENKAELSQKKDQMTAEVMNKLIENVATCVSNRDKQEYPFAKLNKDETVSIYVFQFNRENGYNCTTCNGTCTCVEKCAAANALLNNPYFMMALAQQCQLYNLPLLDKTKPLVQVFKDNDRSPSIIEYQLNLSPESLDTLMKSQPKYSYRGEDSVLKLRRSYTPKPGIIRLAPVEAFDNNHSFIRAAGCQVVEMPMIELLHLLPGFDGKERYFHWIPDEVRNSFALDSSDVPLILRNIYLDAGIIQNENKYYVADQDGTTLVSQPKLDSLVKFCAMNRDTRDFYALYGNCTHAELERCQSIEIKTVDFFRYVQAHLKDKLQRLEKDSIGADPGIQHLQDKWLAETKKGLALLERMLGEWVKPDPETHPHRLFQASAISPKHSTPASASDSKPKPPVK